MGLMDGRRWESEFDMLPRKYKKYPSKYSTLIIILETKFDCFDFSFFLFDCLIFLWMTF